MKRFFNYRDPGSQELRTLFVHEGKVSSPSQEWEEDIDLQGRWLVPAFLDAHCHILPMGLDLEKPSLDGLETREQVLDLILQAHQERPDGWLHVIQYDPAKWGGQQITASELDSISATRPILVKHVSGHASVANTFALQVAGVTPDSPDPSGGSFVRDSSGAFTGLVLETAHEAILSAAPAPSYADLVSGILAAGTSMHAFGIANATDMMTGYIDLDLELAAYQEAATRGAKVQSRLYVQWADVFGPKGIGEAAMRERTASLKGVVFEGIKLFADGAIGSGTAAIYGSYCDKAVDNETGTSGQLIYSPEELKRRILVADRAGFRVAVHAIGDYAVDLVLDAYAACDEPFRHRLEHAMLLSESQIERIAGLGICVTLQPEFLGRFSHVYLQRLGPERTAMLIRCRSLLDAGVPISLNSDRPITPGDPWYGIRCAVDRAPIYSHDESLTPQEGFEAYTSGAWQVSGEPHQAGLRVGAPAWFQVYDIDPIAEYRELPRPSLVVGPCDYDDYQHGEHAAANSRQNP